MVIPVGVNHVIRGWPWLTIAVIVACTTVQIYTEMVAPSEIEVEQWAAQRVKELPAGADEAQEAYVAQQVDERANQIPSVRLGYRSGSGFNYRLVTSAFVHQDWWHLIGNMLFLWLTGAALEDRWRRARFATFYAAGAIAAGLFFSALHAGPQVVLIGASGAISALMGAFLVCFARMRIHFVYVDVRLSGRGRRIGRFDAVAYVALPIWFGVQVLNAWIEHPQEGVAFTAHIGGFVFGLATAGAARLVARWHPQREATKVPDPALRPRLRTPAPVPVLRKRTTEVPRPQPPLDSAGGPRFLV